MVLNEEVYSVGSVLRVLAFSLTLTELFSGLREPGEQEAEKTQRRQTSAVMTSPPRVSARSELPYKGAAVFIVGMNPSAPAASLNNPTCES